jgi:hypothetical protein
MVLARDSIFLLGYFPGLFLFVAVAVVVVVVVVVSIILYCTSRRIGLLCFYIFFFSE